MIVTSPIFCKLIDKIGRKHTLLATGFFQITSWLLVAFSKSIYLFYVSRIFSGLADCSLFAALPTYIAEVTTPKVRSLYGNALIVAMFSGQFLINCVGFYLEIQISAFVMLTFPLLFLITFVFMPETPYYLSMVNDGDSALKSLRRLRGCDEVQEELKQIEADVRRQLSESGRFKDLWSIQSNRRALIVANLTRAFQQFGGISVLATYSQYIFMEAGGNISSGHASMIFSGFLAAVNIFANILTDKFGRKRSMIVSCFGCGTTLLSMAIYFYLQVYTAIDVSQVTWFPILGIILYVPVFSVGLGVVPTLMLGEIFSASVRRYSAMVSNIIFGIFLCSTTKLFQVMMSRYGLCVPFFFFSLCCFVGSVTSYFIIPETKGKTLEEIQQILKGNK